MKIAIQHKSGERIFVDRIGDKYIIYSTPKNSRPIQSHQYIGNFLNYVSQKPLWAVNNLRETNYNVLSVINGQTQFLPKLKEDIVSFGVTLIHSKFYELLTPDSYIYEIRSNKKIESTQMFEVIDQSYIHSEYDVEVVKLCLPEHAKIEKVYAKNSKQNLNEFLKIRDRADFLNKCWAKNNWSYYTKEFK